MSGAQQPVSHVDAVRLQNISSAYGDGTIPKGSLAARTISAADYNMNIGEDQKPIVIGELKEVDKLTSRYSSDATSSPRSQHQNEGKFPHSSQEQSLQNLSQSGHESRLPSQNFAIAQSGIQPIKNDKSEDPLSQYDLHKERQNQFSEKIDHLKQAHSLPEGMQSITKEDARSFVLNQSPVHANEDVERSLNAKAVMSATINEVQQDKEHRDSNINNQHGGGKEEA